MEIDPVSLAALPAALGQGWASSESSDDMAMTRLRAVMKELPAAARRLRDNGIPSKVIADTFSDIGLWAEDFYKVSGRWGLSENAYGWLQNHLRGRLFRVGRMQFCPGRMEPDWNLRAFRHRTNGVVAALADREILFRADGQVSGTNGIEADTRGFSDAFRYFQASDGKTYAQGIALSPYGHAVNRVLRLDLDAWALVLEENMPVANLHIPAGDYYTPKACQEALTEMVSFERQHRKALSALTGVEGPYAAFCLGSWLLDAQLERLLPPASNITECLKSYYLIPVLANEGPALERVFGVSSLPEAPLDETYQRTGLQRAILGFMRTGGRMRYNYGFVLFDEADGFGTEKYRKGFDAFSFQEA